MARLAAVIAALVVGGFLGPPAMAQTSPAIVVIDQERLFQESQLGKHIASDLEERSAALAAENRAIETELVAEEKDLTERRASLAPDEFRKLADAFDEKVERLREEQDAKTRELVAIRDAGRQNFTQSVGPILLEFMRRTGASVMLDRRSVVATSDRVDVSDELIAEIDARVGAGELPPSGDGTPAPAREGQTTPALPRLEEPAVPPVLEDTLQPIVPPD